jgi:hypothetical protein
MNNFECKSCGKEVKLIEGAYIKTCQCQNSGIIANMKAVAYGEAKINPGKKAK